MIEIMRNTRGRARLMAIETTCRRWAGGGRAVWACERRVLGRSRHRSGPTQGCAGQTSATAVRHHEADASHARERGEGLLALGAVQEKDAGGADDAVLADADPQGACVPRGMAAASAWGRVREAACQRAGQAELKERPEKAEKQQQQAQRNAAAATHPP